MTQIVHLTKEQQEHYAEKGYLTGLPAVFTTEEIAQLREELRNLEALLVPGEKMLHIRDWHNTSKWIYDLCKHPQILAYVEGILGPNFYMWGTQFFAKEPNSNDRVAWHQDAYYWPLTPHDTVTVWLAFTDVDDENGAMRVIPGTHNKGLIKHRSINDNSVLTLELEEGTYNESEAKSLILKAGELSLHNDNIVHGSPPNLSDRWRIGLTIRYSSPQVRADPERAPNFLSYMMQGVDTHKHNPQGEPPTELYARVPLDFHGDDPRVVKPKNA